MTICVREAVCRNCATEFTFEAGGGKPRPLCQVCETSHKWCPPCGYALPHIGFQRDPRNRDGLEGSCKRCKAQAHFARYRGKYRTDPRRARNSKILGRYGLSASQWDQMVIEHGGRCAICNLATPSLHIDHCHSSGAVRGLLCPPCNMGLGHFADDIDRMVAATAYLLKEG